MPDPASVAAAIAAAIAKHLISRFFDKSLEGALLGESVSQTKNWIDDLRKRKPGLESQVRSRCEQVVLAALTSTRLPQDVPVDAVVIEVETTLLPLLSGQSYAQTNLNRSAIAERLLQEREDLRKQADITGLEGPIVELRNRIIPALVLHILPLVELTDPVRIETDRVALERLDRIERYLLREEKAAQDEAADFERRYRMAVAKELNQMDLLGVPRVDESEQAYPLTTAYVRLRSTQGDQADPRGLPVEAALARAEHVLVLGMPGSGKSTLLKWLAVQAAAASFEGLLAHWNGMVPFYVQLRAFVKQDPDGNYQLNPPAPAELTHVLQDRTLRGSAPEGWAQRLIKQDRALILLDGVDEVPLSLRSELWKYVDSLVELWCSEETPAGYRRCLSRVVVSSRPYALDPDQQPPNSTVRAHFFETSLCDLALEDADHLIDRWHDAMATVLRKLGRSDQCEQLPELCRSLQALGRTSALIRGFTRTPLLCALLCALYRAHGGNPPANRVRLYQEAIDHVIHLRAQYRPSKDDFVELNLDQKKDLLRTLAWWFLRRGATQAEGSELIALLEWRARSMSLPLYQGRPPSGEDLLKTLSLTSGVLREPSMGQIDWVHKTFMEFLAAERATKEQEYELFLFHVADPAWHEAYVFAVGLSGRKDQTHLVDGVLNSDQSQFGIEGLPLRDAERSVRALLAAGCIEACSDDLKPEQVEKLTELVKQLLPPQTEAAATAVIACGEAAIPYLARRREWGREESIAAIRCLAGIGGDRALHALVSFTDFQNKAPEQSPIVVEDIMPALVQAWSSFGRREYARRILYPATRNQDVLVIEGQESLEGLDELIGVPRLVAYNCVIGSDPTVIGIIQRFKIDSLASSNLVGADLTSANLSGTNIHSGNLHGANLQEANLQGANLEGAYLQRANLQGANLQGANLQRAISQGTSFQGANLEGANLFWANLREANLQKANLREANLQKAIFQRAVLAGANLQGTDLRGAIIQGVSLQRANLQGANLRGANLRGGDLRGVNLEGANLQEVILEGADLEGAILRRAILQRADLEGAKLEGANLREANLQKANLEGANLRGANLQKSNLRGSNLRKASIQGADLLDVFHDSTTKWPDIGDSLSHE